MSPDFFPPVYVFKTTTSTPIDFNNATITQAKMTVVSSGIGSITLYMTANGGGTWDEVTNGLTHTFAVSGTDLRWRIEGAGKTITLITIDNYH